MGWSGHTTVPLGGRYATAFTLLELLVAIAVIAILASLILPALSSSKNRAVQMTDVNNLKEIMTAVQIYVNDSNDLLPWPNWKSGDHLGRSGWLYVLNSSLTGPSQFDIHKGLLWPVIKDQKLYMCPMDNTNLSLFNSRQQQLSSYAMNGAVVGYDRTNYPAVKLSRMRPDDVAFWETDETQPSYFNDGANYPAEGVSARHQKGAINANCGGAVSYIRLGLWYIQVYDTNRNSLWCYPESIDGR